MLKLVLLLSTNLAYASVSNSNLIDSSSCIAGYQYEGLCYSKCPSGFWQFQGFCKPKNKPFFTTNDLDSNLTQNYSQNEEKIKQIEYSDKRGLFFNHFSSLSVQGPSDASYTLTVNLFLLILEDGNLVAAHGDFIILKVDKFNIEVMADGNLILKKEIFDYGTWLQVFFRVKMIGLDEAQAGFGVGESQGEKQFFIDSKMFWDRRFCIGDLGNGDGFAGFFYRADFFNQIFEEKFWFDLDGCFFEENENIKLQVLAQLESLCSSHPKRKLLACLNPPSCTVSSSSCPTFFTADSQQTCVLQGSSSKQLILFYFDTSYKDINDLPPSSYKLSLVSTSETAQGAYKRGKYLNGISDYYQISPQVNFPLNTTFVFWIKFEGTPISALISKVNGLKILLGEGYFAFYMNKWFMFKGVRVLGC